MSIKDLEVFNPYPTVVIPQGADGAISHAICVIDDLIFDTTQEYALKCTRNSLSWICNCGSQGFEDVYAVIRFERGFKSSTLIRYISYNSGQQQAIQDEVNQAIQDEDNQAARQANRVVIDEESYLTFGVGGSTDEDINPDWERLRTMVQPVVDMRLTRQLARLAMNPVDWEDDPIQLSRRCQECGEKPCLWLEHRHELMRIHRDYYDHLPIDDQPPNIIHRLRLYNEMVRYMNRCGIGEGVRARLPKCIEDGVHEIYPG